MLRELQILTLGKAVIAAFFICLFSYAGNANTITATENVTTVKSVQLDFFRTVINPDNQVLVIWQTSDEMDCKTFQVMRSNNDKDYTLLKEFVCHGGHGVMTKYSFIDENPMNGRNYYILRQVENTNHSWDYGPLLENVELGNVVTEPAPDNAIEINSIQNPDNPSIQSVGLEFFRSTKTSSDKVQLYWKTTWEAKCSGFEILRSTNNWDYKRIGEVRGNGTTIQTNNYQFIDQAPKHGRNYYKLRQIDISKKSNDYGPVVEMVDRTGGAALMKAVAEKNVTSSIEDPNTEMEAADERSVEMDYFRHKAMNNGTKVLLMWRTLWEKKCANYEILRSKNNVDYTVIGNIRGNDSTPFTSDYQFVDEKPMHGKNYYKLRQIDTSGKGNNYGPLRQNIDTTGGIIVTPNPSNGEFMMRAIDVPTEPIEVYNAIGSLVHTINPSSINRVDLTHLPKGIYYIRSEFGVNAIQIGR